MHAANKMNDSPKPLYLDDLSVGQRFSSASYLMDEGRIKAFAAEFDPQPFHLDEAHARHTLFGGLAASGWHMAAVMMRLLVDGGLPLATGIIGLGGEIEWSQPVRPGDTLRVESEILEIVPSRSKPNQGIVRVRNIMLNQNGDQVQAFTAKILVFKHPTANPT
jgi:acyl dehydratase